MSHLAIRDFVAAIYRTAIAIEVASPEISAFLRDAAGLMISKACEINRLRSLLAECIPHVIASSGAEHTLDGLSPKLRPVDDLVDRINTVLKPGS